jgi:hypothetical protein
MMESLVTKIEQVDSVTELCKDKNMAVLASHLFINFTCSVGENFRIHPSFLIMMPRHW